MGPLNASSIKVKYFKMYQIKCYVKVISIKTDWLSSDIVPFFSLKVSKNWVITYLLTGPLNAVQQNFFDPLKGIARIKALNVS